MSEDKFYKNFPRTGKRYGTLLQITPNQVNLTSNLHLKYIFDKTQKYTKPIHSVYSLQILDDILPDINSNKRNKEEIIMVNTFGPGSTDEQHIDHKSKEYVNFYIVLTCVLEFILYVLMMIFLSNTTLADTIQFEMKAVPVFSVVYFNKFFLRLPFYRHHYFALTLIFFGAVSVLICHFFCQPLIGGNYEASLMINFLFFIQKIFRGFKEVIDTYILQENNISPFLLLFYQGIIGTILCVLFAIGFQFVPCTSFWKMNFCDMGHNIENFGDFFEQFKDGKIISLMIGLLFASLVVEVLRMQTKYYLTASNFTASDGFLMN